MRGQKLFVRPIESEDTPALRRFFAAYANSRAIPTCGLVGKLVGELVAVMAIDISGPREILIESLIVAPEYRRKRVGRVMLAELEALGARMERDRLVVVPSAEARGFLEKSGFVDDGTRMVRRVRR